MGRVGLRATSLHSGLDPEERRRRVQAIRGGEVELVYAAPEGLEASAGTALSGARLSLVAVDEAHCISHWGHDFRPAYRKLAGLRQRFGDVPVLALTATATPRVAGDIAEQLGMRAPVLFRGSFFRENLRLEVHRKGDDGVKSREEILAHVRAHRGESGIVYCIARRSAESVAEFLRSKRVRALAYHAGLEPAERERVQDAFLSGAVDVVVATVAFGMGIDKPDIRYVIHRDMPGSIEGYCQEIGRAGRDGGPADAWMTYGLADVVQQRRLIEMSEAEDTYKRLSAAKLDAMLGLAEAADCRRVRLLAYFGEPSGPCGNCDNCLSPPQVRDASDDARKLLSCIYRCQQASGFGFAATHIIDVLRGKLTDKVQKFGHGKLSTFAVGADVGEAEWRLLLRQLVAQHLVEVDYERFNVLRLTEASRAVLRGERRIELRRQLATARGKARKAKAAAAGTMDAAAAALYERLRDWRAKVARSHGVPAYVVFHDATLQAIAQARPASVEALRGIAGLGERKLANYGEQLLDLIAG
jgi:ATP-dependent DNA helicase RecQ